MKKKNEKMKKKSISGKMCHIDHGIWRSRKNVRNREAGRKRIYLRFYGIGFGVKLKFGPPLGGSLARNGEKKRNWQKKSLSLSLSLMDRPVNKKKWKGKGNGQSKKNV